MKRFYFLFYLWMGMTWMSVFSQEKIVLYPNGRLDESNELKTEEKLRDDHFLLDVSEPRMYAYMAPKAKNNGTAVLICPGGRYAGLEIIKEGEAIAQWFNSKGISAFVLYYRMPNGHHKIPLQDAQTALAIIRKNARKWDIDRKKIGVIGFSAGGHLASTLGTHFKSKDERPDFMILVYPVISMDDQLTHSGSKKNLFGESSTDELVKHYSNELRVTKDTPPTFIIHAKDDKVVPVENSKLFYRALLKNDVRCEIVLTQRGGHGFGLEKQGTDFDGWENRLEMWMKSENLIK